MSRYMMIRRLRGPAFLLLIGVIALLAQAHIMSWGHSWPLYLILIGVFMLAERAALAADGGVPPGYPPGTPYPGGPYPGSPYPGSSYPGAVDPASAVQSPAQPGSAIVPAHSQDLEKGPRGGQS